MRIVHLMLKNMTQIVRDWKAAFFMIVVPVIFTLLMGFIFGGFDSGEEDPRLPVGFVDRDESAISAHLQVLLERSDAIRPVVLADEEKAKAQVRQENLAAAVIVPSGYGDHIFTAPLHPTVIVDENTVAGTTAYHAIQTALIRLSGGAQIALLSAKALEAQGETIDDTFLTATLERSLTVWNDPRLTLAETQSGAVEEEDSTTPMGFPHASVANMVQFSLMGVIGAAELIVNERKSRTLSRMLTTTISRVEIILSF